MNRKIVIAIMGFVWLVVNAGFGQSYAEEALMVSRVSPGGSARIQGLGGVQNSLGGDVSSAYYNPAGLGMYNRSEFSITPGYLVADNTSSYLGNSVTTSKNNLMLPNMGIAFHTNKDGSKGVWGGTFAINFNRINNFNSTFSYQGTNPDNSIIDYFLSDAAGTGISQFSPSGFNYNTPTGLAFFNYLIGPQDILSPPGPADQYFTDVSGIPFQKETVQMTGAQNQWSFSYGVNFNDKIFVGGGFGIASLSYKATKTYTEEFSDPSQPMSPMVLDESLTLSGSGFNLTLGLIFRPINQFQVGFSAATPTSYQIADTYEASMTTQWKNFQYLPGEFLNSESASTDILTSNYDLTTPWRLSGGLTFFFGKSGFISADAEWMNYSSTKYSSNEGDDYSADNTTIKGLYKSVVNLRFGGEYRLNDFRFRGGYSLMPDPFQAPQNNVDRALSSYSAGFGYRKTKFYVDLAYIFGQGSNSYRPYSINSPTSPLVNLEGKTQTFLVTFGFPF